MSHCPLLTDVRYDSTVNWPPAWILTAWTWFQGSGFQTRDSCAFIMQGNTRAPSRWDSASHLHPLDVGYNCDDSIAHWPETFCCPVS